MISKELLSEVLGCKISKTMDEQGITSVTGIDDAEDGTYLIFRWQGGESSSDRYINIYELAHKCKEWAWHTHKHSIETSISDRVECTIYDGFPYAKNEKFTYWEPSEPEAIFKACQWIKDNKDKQ